MGKFCSLSIVGDKPAIAYTEAVNEQLQYARATVAEPSDFSDWTSQHVDYMDTPVEGCVSLYSDGTRPYIAYINRNADYHLSHAWADTAEPNIGDWVISDGPQFTVPPSHLSLTAVNGGRGLALHLGGTVNDLAYLRSDLPAPSNPLDWHVHTVQSAGEVGRFASLTTLGGMPAIFHITDGQLSYTQALDVRPSLPADWRHHTVDDCGTVAGGAAAALVDGRPCVIYSVDAQHEIRCAWAKTVHPSDMRDWAYSTVIDVAMEIYYDPSIADVDGRPAVTFYHLFNQQLTYGRMSL